MIIAVEFDGNCVVGCADPAALQKAADEFQAKVEQVARQRLCMVPNPLSEKERAAGYQTRLSIFQAEFSDNLVFHKTAVLNRLYERVLSEHLHLGRPNMIKVMFDRPAVRHDLGDATADGSGLRRALFRGVAAARYNLIMPTDPLRWIDTQHDRMVSLVSEWCGINSGSRNLAGLAGMSTALQSAFASLAGEMHEISLPAETVIDQAGNVVSSPLGKALSIRKRPDAATRVLLSIHMDTVYGPDDAFQNARWIDDRTMNGPGVADAKGGLCVMLIALEALEKSSAAEKIGWEVLINPDEELGSPGSAGLLVECAQRNQIGLVFEPAHADGALVGERKGSGNFTVLIRGRSAHAGRDFHQGRNAIHAAAELVVALEEMNRTNPGLIVNVGKIDGGGPTNIVPDLAIVRLNIRLPAHDPAARIEAQLQRALDQVRKRDGIIAELTGGFTSPPRPMDVPTTKLYQRLADIGTEIGLALTWHSSGGVSDANKLAAAGLPVIDTLGPSGGSLHSEQEFLLVDTLTQKAKLAALFMMRIAHHTSSTEATL